MIEKLNTALEFIAFFSAAKIGKTGLTVTADVYNPAGTLVVTAAAATAIGGGFYKYTLASGSNTTAGVYKAIFKTADTTVDAQHVPSIWCVAVAGVGNLDAAVSSRSTYAGADTAGTTTLLSRVTGAPLLAANYTAAPSAATVAAAVVDQALAGHTTTGTVGGQLQAAGASGDPLGQLVPGAYAVGTAGYAVGRLNAPTPDGPVVVVPGPPADADVCRVYGYLETVDNKPAAGVAVTFTLIAAGLVAADRIIAGRVVNASTDVDGMLLVDLQRNDTLDLAGTSYLVQCAAIGVPAKTVVLSTATVDIKVLLAV